MVEQSDIIGSLPIGRGCNFKQAGGLSAISRWLSEATPPEHVPRDGSIPEGDASRVILHGEMVIIASV